MPIVSERQRRLMRAAAAGKSKKVSKKVAKKYLAHGKKKPSAGKRKTKSPTRSRPRARKRR